MAEFMLEIQEIALSDELKMFNRHKRDLDLLSLDRYVNELLGELME